MKRLISSPSASTNGIIAAWWMALLFAIGLSPVVSQACEPDSTIFRQHVMLRIMPSVTMHSLQPIFRYWKEQDEAENKRVNDALFWHPSEYYEPGYVSSYLIPETYYRQGDEERNYQNALRVFRDEFNAKNRQPDSIAAEKRRLMASLEAMDTLLHNKPLCFQVINAKYKGSIPRYVDALYAQSFMTSKRRFRRMVRRRSPKLLVKDLGVNYSLSMALYEAWIRQHNSSDNAHK